MGELRDEIDRLMQEPLLTQDAALQAAWVEGEHRDDRALAERLAIARTLAGQHDAIRRLADELDKRAMPSVDSSLSEA